MSEFLTVQSNSELLIFTHRQTETHKSTRTNKCTQNTKGNTHMDTKIHTQINVCADTQTHKHKCAHMFPNIHTIHQQVLAQTRRKDNKHTGTHAYANTNTSFRGCCQSTREQRQQGTGVSCTRFADVFRGIVRAEDVRLHCSDNIRRNEPNGWESARI